MGHNNTYKQDDMRELGSFTCSTSQLNKLKLQFSSVINSQRSIDKIKNIEDLLTILKKRDELTSQHLDKIAVSVGFNHRSAASASNSRLNNYMVVQKQQTNTPVRNDGLNKVYSLLSERLGSYWIDFARALKVPEEKIDQFFKRNDEEQVIRDILEYHEQNCDPRIWRQTLLKALVNARRKDLSDQVSALLDRFQIIDFQKCYT